MTRNLLALTMAGVVLAGAIGCSNSNTPLAPASNAPSTPTIGIPTPQSPVNGQTASDLAPKLTASAATVDIASYVLQYRFQVFNDGGALVQDSGLIASPAWTTAAALTPNRKHTWKVRAESQGFSGSWSDAAAFSTPDYPPAYNRPIGNWQACAGLKASALVRCVWDAVHPTDSVSDMEVAKRVAWLDRAEGMGLLIKTSGDNVVLWQGYSFSCSRVCFTGDGHVYKIIGDAGPGGANTPGFSDNDFVDKSQCIAAIDPSKP